MPARRAWHNWQVGAFLVSLRLPALTIEHTPKRWACKGDGEGMCSRTYRWLPQSGRCKCGGHLGRIQ